MPRRKKPVLINLPPELVREARELGLNISKIAENALREYIRRLKGSNEQTDCSQEVKGDDSPLMVLRPGFEPGSRAREARILGRTIVGARLSGSTGATHGRSG